MNKQIKRRTKQTIGWLVGAMLLAALVAVISDGPWTLDLGPSTWAHLLDAGGFGLMAVAPASVNLTELGRLLTDSTNRIERYVTESERRLKSVESSLDKQCAQIDHLRRSGHVAGPAKREPHKVSEECARALAAVCILQADSFGGLKGLDNQRREALVNVSMDALGIHGKAALTTSDIPLPTAFSGEVVELVSEFGAARRHGTTYPLGTGQTKIPRLGTDPTFGLIAMSAAITEKSPTVVFVTFNAEKFGGLVRLPSELDADSIVDLGQFLARYCARQIAYLEDYNFFAGTGAGSGINGSVAGLTSSTITNAKVFQMATTKTHYSDAVLADIRRIRQVVDAPVLRTGAYYCHPTFEQHFAGLNTAGDKPYNPQAQIVGVGASGFATIGPTFDGFPIRWVDVLPAYSTGVNVSKVFMLFGDPSYQYLGVRPGMSLEVSRDVFFATDELAVRCLERFTIGLMAIGAVSGLETAAS